MDVNFIVLIGFSLFIILSLRFGYRKTMQGLDENIQEIRKTLEQAERQLELANKQLKEEKEKQKAFALQSQETIAQRQREEEELRKSAKAELDHLLEVRQQGTDMMFDKLRIEAIEQMRFQAAEQITKIIENLANNTLTASQHQALNDQAIEQVRQLLNENSNSEKNNDLPIAVNE